VNDDTATQGIPTQRTASDPVERWLPVVGYEGLYEISSLGRVKRLGRTNSQGMRLQGRLKTLTPVAGPDRKVTPYLRVGLTRDGSQTTVTVHSQVALAFIGPRPEGMVVRHLDGNCLNNALSNITYGTYSENNSDTVKHGHHVAANKTHCKRGHKFDAVNTYISKTGHRRCRPCAAAYQMARNRRLRAMS
jgi:hypothetical protein